MLKEDQQQEQADKPKSPLQGDRGIHVLGIRHHGPGSARAVRSYLEELKPDIVLVEGPPEADAMLQWADHEELKPPVAILCYQPDNLQQSVFYPFAEFSPEWQAILFAKKNKIPVRFFDLPMAHQFALDKQEAVQQEEPGKKRQPEELPKDDLISPEQLNSDAAGMEEEVTEEIRKDPISYLAEAAGYEEGEKWWEQMFEYRTGCEQVFDAVAEAMQSLRENLPQKEDNDLLKGLPKAKVECTWIPWTYNRLSYYSGYGAGIHSPGWYEHIWHHPTDDGTRWMSKVAALFREKGMDTSVAHVIEAVRLAETLASLRGFTKAGLEELNEATLSVLCNGEDILLQLIHNSLIVSNKMGEVPTNIPKPPLQVDIEKSQKTLRLPPTADFKDYTLDLRKESDLAKSIFLHRLRLLGIGWGTSTQTTGKGTFKEQWRLQWNPSFSIDIIERGSWGNTVEEAANKYIIHQAEKTTAIQTIAQTLEEALPAELHSAVEVLIRQLNNLSAANGDAVQLMEAVPPLVSVVRYGNVRKTDSERVLSIVRSMITRICISLPNAVVGLVEEAAQTLAEAIANLHDALSLLEEGDIIAQWQHTLLLIAESDNSAPVISGYATRLLADYKVLQGEGLVKAFHYRMSRAAAPDKSAAWLEGFLKGSGSILLVDEDLWTLVNQWVAGLDKETFTQLLPLLRRTFAAFTPPEKRKLGEKVKGGGVATGIKTVVETGIEAERGKKGIPVVMQLLGLTKTTNV
jgi:hypothetical protein